MNKRLYFDEELECLTEDGKDCQHSEQEHGSYTIEDRLLIKHDVRAAFRQLTYIDRVVVALMQRYTAPPGYTGPWPLTPEQVGEYLQRTFSKYRGRRLSRQSVIAMNRLALRRMRVWLEKEEGHGAV